MPIPVDERREVPCDSCGCHFKKGAMERRGPESFVCKDRDRCRARRAERDRLDSWKRGGRT